MNLQPSESDSNQALAAGLALRGGGATVVPRLSPIPISHVQGHTQLSTCLHQCRYSSQRATVDDHNDPFARPCDACWGVPRPFRPAEALEVADRVSRHEPQFRDDAHRVWLLSFFFFCAWFFQGKGFFCARFKRNRRSSPRIAVTRYHRETPLCTSISFQR